MGTRYTTNAASGYNATPPADDATVSEANKGKWSTIKEKLSDPLKTLAEAINTDLVTHFDNGPVAYTSNQTLGAAHYGQVIQASGSGTTLTLSDATALGAGWNCEIVSVDTTNTVSIARATAADLINETTANMSLLPLQQIKAVVNAAANGFLVSVQGRHSKTYQNGEIQRNTAQVRWSKGADVASANALTLGTDGNYFDITGTTAITSIGTLGVGTIVKLHFDDALTLTHNATDLILPGGANITTAAGDEAEFVEYATGDWRCTGYSKAAGMPSGVVLATGASSSVATVDIVMTSYTAYKTKRLIIHSCVPATDGTALWLRTSTDGGSNYANGATSYSSQGATASEIVIAGSSNIGSATTEGVTGTVDIYNSTSSALWTQVAPLTVWITNDATPVNSISTAINLGGAVRAAQDDDAIRLMFSSGNIASISWTLLGFN